MIKQTGNRVYSNAGENYPAVFARTHSCLVIRPFAAGIEEFDVHIAHSRIIGD